MCLKSVRQLQLQFWIRVERCGFSRALVRSGLVAAHYEHGWARIVALPQKDLPFTTILTGFGPVVGLWLDSPLYLLMGTNQPKMVAPSLETSIRGSVDPFFNLGSALAVVPPSAKQMASYLY